MKSKYVGGFPGEDMRAVPKEEVERVISAQRQYGTSKEARVAAMRILRRGDTVADGHGFCVRLRQR